MIAMVRRESSRLTYEVLAEHALLYMRVRGCRAAVMYLPDDLIRFVSVALLEGVTPAEMLHYVPQLALEKITISQLIHFAIRFRKAAEHVRRSMYAATADGEAKPAMQLSRTIDAAGETKQVLRARQRVACLEHFRRVRAAAGGGWLDRAVTELRQIFPELRISRTTLYRWDRAYHDPAVDLPKLLDTRGGAMKGRRFRLSHIDRPITRRAQRPSARPPAGANPSS